MKRIVFAAAILLLLLVVALAPWRQTARTDPTAAPTARPVPSAATPTSAPPEPRRTPPPRPERSTLADALNSPTTDIRADLRLVLDLVDTFRSNFLQTGNPTGTNAEITAALTGRNPLRLSLIPSDHPAINREGELCDRWGTPFFFHAESATRMEIRSAGPDRKMWTEDDVVMSP
jgi:hypothetical protein